MVSILVFFGPTGSGKTSLLEKLSSSGAFGGRPVEIISADSMQVYRGMDIGTAKPSLEERQKLPHHLIDIRDPNEQFNVGDFVRLAEEAIAEAAGRDALPVVSGGTGFYLKNLVYGISEAPPSDGEIRRVLKEELSFKGAASLMDELKKADPVSAERIHINDEYRLLRALEVCRLTGRPLSSYPSPWSRNSPEGTALTRDGFNFILVGLRRSREELYRRINERTAAMFRLGLPDEVKALFEKSYTPLDPGLRAIGYREFFIENYDETGEDNHTPVWRLTKDLSGVESLIAQNSRRYAKRQITLFSPIPGVNWIDLEGEDYDNAIREMLLLLRDKL